MNKCCPTALIAQTGYKLGKLDVDQLIDTTFDMYSDTPPGGDPDACSRTLQRYHRMLWSKMLPGGGFFGLSADTSGTRLSHISSLGEFRLSSDGIGATLKNVKPMKYIIDQVPSTEVDEFFSICSTIGAYIIFPCNRIDQKPTINGARGLNYKIGDRFDLTLECIRRHYTDQVSPLSRDLKRYQDFFGIFENFRSYCEFFLLDDLLQADGSVRFFLPFDDFATRAMPSDVSQYRIYRDALVDFVTSRNDRISGIALSAT